MKNTLLTLIAAGTLSFAANIPVDLSRVRPGPVRVEASEASVAVNWTDGESRAWRAVFSLDTAKPLISSISANDRVVVEWARPLLECTVGKRRGGWDAFFDFPGNHPDGTRSFIAAFIPAGARAQTVGDRLELTFSGLRLGIFSGDLVYVFYPGSRLIEQRAVVTTNEPEVAFFYNAGMRMGATADLVSGKNMASEVAYYDTQGRFQTVASDGPQRHAVAVRYRTLAARTGGGSVAVMPPPHSYFMARDFTSNMENLWHVAWRGTMSIGIRQLPDDNTAFYPWMNAPPGSRQQLSVFFLLSDREPKTAVDAVLRYTHGDRFPSLPGYKTFAPHWHFNYTVQAMGKPADWVPPFKPVLQSLGVDAAAIFDFHGEENPDTSGPIRLKELDGFFRYTRRQSESNFLLIPGEEANVHLGGHFGLIFPKPVYWYKTRSTSDPFLMTHPVYGPVYHTGDAKDLIDIVRREGGYVYQAHPRTKGSTGYPDKIRDTDYFRDPRYFGTGWKAMPTDLSRPHLSARGFKVLDDLNNWGMRKFAVGEVDVFQIDSTHELYAHMNVNYVQIPKLPDYDHYGTILDAVANGRFFVTTGEVLLPETRIAGTGDTIEVHARAEWTFPLRLAEIVWGDGSNIHYETIPLDSTREFSKAAFDWKVKASGWKWARLAVWDVAGNGAFTQPVLSAR